MTLVITIIFFTLGLIIGSFLNVVIFRLNTERTFRGRSGCMTCQKQLCWYELFPLFSFLAQKGRCRHCRLKISIQYPIVEFITGFVFAVLFLKFQNTFYVDAFSFALTYAYYTTVFSVLIVISVYDLRHKIIPDSLSAIFGFLAFLGLFFFSGYLFFPHIPSVLEVCSGVFLALPFALIWFVSKGKWMGLGDAKLAVGLGWVLSLGQVFSAVVSAFWTGAVAGILLILFSKKYGLKSEIPFAPFLVLGTFIAFIFELNLLPLGF